MKVGLSNNLKSIGAFQDKKSGSAASPVFTFGQNITSSPSFRGINYDRVRNSCTGLISNISDKVYGLYNNKLMVDVAQISDVSQLVNKTDQQIGEGFFLGKLNKFNELYGSRAQDFIQVEENSIKFRDRTFLGKVVHGATETLKLPLDVLCAVSGAMNKVPFLKNLGFVQALNDSKIVQNRINEKAGEEIFYRLKGVATIKGGVEQIVKDMYKVPSGDAVGNYAPKSERALNRLGTGAISSWFVGKDYYNLTMYEQNDKKKAKESEKVRRNREYSRIALNAFLTYAFLGAFSSVANKYKIVACMVIASTSLISEIATRIKYGVPLHPLTPEGAKKLNEKRAKKQGKIPGTSSKYNSNQTQPVVPFSMPSFTFKNGNTNKVFDVFTNPNQNQVLNGSLNKFYSNPYGSNFTGNQLSSVNSQYQIPNNNKNAKKAPQEEKKSGFKKIFNLKNIILTICALDLVYGFARSKSKGFDKFLNNASEFFKDLHDRIGRKRLIVKGEEFETFLEGFNGTKLEVLKEGYSRLIAKPTFSEAQYQTLMQGSINGSVHIKVKDELNSSKTKTFLNALKAEARKVTEARLRDKAASDPTFDFEAAKTAAMSKIEEAFDNTYKNGKWSSNLHVDHVHFDLEKVTRPDGTHFYQMKNPKYGFDNGEERFLLAGLTDAVEALFKSLWTVLSLPLQMVEMLAGKSKEQARLEKELSNIRKNLPATPDLGELYHDCKTMFDKYRGVTFFGLLKRTPIPQEKFAEYIEGVHTKCLNTDTSPRYPQTSLASLSRNFVTAISSYFFINDFRNEILLQSDGENVEKAKEVTKEKGMHKFCNFLFNKFFMELFNNTFKSAYLGSLTGATSVAIATEFTNESSIRNTIGIPTKKMESREAIDEFEKKHLEAKGFKGWYFRTMAKVTGKKRLSEKAEKKN